MAGQLNRGLLICNIFLTKIINIFLEISQLVNQLKQVIIYE